MPGERLRAAPLAPFGKQGGEADTQETISRRGAWGDSSGTHFFVYLLSLSKTTGKNIWVRGKF